MIRRPIPMALLLVAAAAAEGSAGGYNLEREIAWARSRWPDDLQGVRFRAATAKLVNWVPPRGAIEVWAFSPAHACTPIELRRPADSTRVSPSGAAWLVGKEIVGHDFRQGREIRAYREFTIGFVFSSGDDEIRTEAQDASGKWQLAESSGTGAESASYGALSDVDAEVARFGGEPLALHPMCAGPIEWLKCPSGGERPCDRCRRIALIPAGVADYFSDGGLLSRDRLTTCQEPCPTRPENPALARLRQLEERANIWRPQRQSDAAIPSLHRTLAGCMEAHFPKVRAGNVPAGP